MDYVLLNGDQANFETSFVAATVEVKAGVLSASGSATLGTQKLCVKGDEKSVKVSDCSYTTTTYSTPGTGTLEIASLEKDHTSTKSQAGGKALMLVGGAFKATFKVVKPATQPTSPFTPDDTTEYSGSGTFLTTNSQLQAT
jgi:Contractile injection system spike tip protein